MNIKQLRCIHEIVRHDFNASRAAEALHTTQPAVSAQVRQLETELGVRIFERNGKRLTGLTEPGVRVLELARRVLEEVEDIRRVGADFRAEDEGTLVIATTHTQARYALPETIRAFRTRYPKVKLRIRQGAPTDLCRWVQEGEADFAIATEAIPHAPGLSMLPCYRWNRCLVAPHGHPLLEVHPLTLEAIADHSLITYDFAFAGRSVVEQAFAQAGLYPEVVLTALDSDVLKHYVALGLGVGILAKMAYDPENDRDLAARDLSHLFPDSTTHLGYRRGRYLRGYMREFIRLFVPHLPEGVLDNGQ